MRMTEMSAAPVGCTTSSWKERAAVALPAVRVRANVFAAVPSVWSSTRVAPPATPGENAEK